MDTLNELVKLTLPKLKSYVGTILTSKGKGHIEAYDIIHSAYILLFVSGLEFSFENMRRPIWDTINDLNEADNLPLNADTDRPVKKGIIGKLITTGECKYCKGCSNDLPVAFFNKRRVLNNGTITYQTLCKVCADQQNKESKRRRLADPAEYQEHYAKQRKRLGARRAIIQNNPLLHAHFKAKNKLECRVSRINKRLKLTA